MKLFSEGYKILWRVKLNVVLILSWRKSRVHWGWWWSFPYACWLLGLQQIYFLWLIFRNSEVVSLIQSDGTCVALERKLIWNLMGVKRHQLVTGRLRTNTVGMSTAQSMWLIKRQLPSRWANLKLKMQTDRGGISENQWDQVEILYVSLWIYISYESL